MVLCGYRYHSPDYIVVQFHSVKAMPCFCRLRRRPGPSPAPMTAYNGCSSCVLFLPFAFEPVELARVSPLPDSLGGHADEHPMGSSCTPCASTVRPGIRNKLIDFGQSINVSHISVCSVISHTSARL